MPILNASNIPQVKDEPSLAAYTVLPVKNDHIQLDDGSLFVWIEGSTATPDGVYIVEQAAAVGLGLWHKQITAKGILTFAITLEDTNQGEISQKIDYAATGILTSNFNIPSYEEPTTDGLIIQSVGQSGNELLGVTYENQSGGLLTGQVLNVKFLVI